MSFQNSQVSRLFISTLQRVTCVKKPRVISVKFHSRWDEIKLHSVFPLFNRKPGIPPRCVLKRLKTEKLSSYRKSRVFLSPTDLAGKI